jgi:hypothetical protein
MKLENIIYSVREILKSKSPDSRIDDRMLIDMINRYRAYNIKVYWDTERYIKQEWFSNLGIMTPTPVNSADDPNIQYTSIIFGKIEIPRGIDISKENTFFIRSASKHQRVEEKDMHILFKMIETEDEMLDDYIGYFWNGNILYTYPHQSKIWVSRILADPLEAITYNALYDYEGTLVSAQGTKRNITIKDEYPICEELAVKVILDILTKEFNLERASIPDVKVDGADTDDLIKSKL